MLPYIHVHSMANTHGVSSIAAPFARFSWYDFSSHSSVWSSYVNTFAWLMCADTVHLSIIVISVSLISSQPGVRTDIPNRVLEGRIDQKGG